MRLLFLWTFARHGGHCGRELPRRNRDPQTIPYKQQGWVTGHCSEATLSSLKQVYSDLQSALSSSLARGWKWDNKGWDLTLLPQSVIHTSVGLNTSFPGLDISAGPPPPKLVGWASPTWSFLSSSPVSCTHPNHAAYASATLNVTLPEGILFACTLPASTCSSPASQHIRLCPDTVTTFFFFVF